MLGEAVYGRFSSIARVKATDIDLNEAWLSYADVRDYPQVLNSIMDFNPHVVMNLAAITDLELCEKDPENAWMTNALGAENLVLASFTVGSVTLRLYGAINCSQINARHPRCASKWA